ncbi:uncharacterized protein LOC141657653 [Silene latifolia]|uniref:uncharacterized protein LOC141657653 n=1 Tax=Silene latifolia TaxID=37657 RepID=UPI003D77386C
MATPNLNFLLILIPFTLCISICGGSTTSSSPNNRRILNIETRQDDSYTPSTILPTTTPITNPANFPPYTPTPTIVTIPASTPTSLTPLNPMPTTPTTTIPSPTTTTPITPVTNPTTTYPGPNTNPNPNPNPVPAGQAPVVSGQTWCVAQAGADESTLQSALDYACGIGGADCSTIQQGASCYNPNTLQNHASFAFNSYFQKNPVATSCVFGGAAMLVNTNPSSGSCIYPSSATGAGGGTTGTPASTIPPATTSSTNGASPYGGVGSPYDVPASGSFGSPPFLMNSSYPASGFPTSYGPDSPPTGTSYPAGSTSTQPCISFVILVLSLSIANSIFSSQ